MKELKSPQKIAIWRRLVAGQLVLALWCSFASPAYSAGPATTADVSVEGNSAAISNINAQQANYNWMSSQIVKWKSYTGKTAEGVLYLPENFDATKKYPMIVYFYERNNQTVHNYLAPAPTPSRLNIPFFASRGYVVFVPDIWYQKGYPGQGAYDYILSGTRAIIQKGFIDSTKVGLQGQSWGGYQIAYLINKTKLYAAAWAGADPSRLDPPAAARRVHCQHPAPAGRGPVRPAGPTALALASGAPPGRTPA